MAGRRIFSEKDARRCLAAATAAGSGLAVWARRQGIDGRSLNAWRVNLERRGGAPLRSAQSKLVELVAAPAPARVPPVHAPYVLHVGGVVLEIGATFDEQSLRRLVGLLKSC